MPVFLSNGPFGYRPFSPQERLTDKVQPEFRAEDKNCIDLGLINNMSDGALETTERDGWILLSTNCSGLSQRDLEYMGRHCLKVARRTGQFCHEGSLPDFPPGAGASTVWLHLG